MTISGQTGGPEDLGTLNAVLFGPLRHVANGTKLTCFAECVAELGIIYRVNGSLVDFPGETVGNVRFGHKNNYISIDIVFAQYDWNSCDVPCASEMLQSRLSMLSGVLRASKRANALIVGDVEGEIDNFASLVLAETQKLPRWAHWVPGVGVRENKRG